MGGLEEQSLGLKCIMGRLLFVYALVSPPTMGGQGGARLVQDFHGPLIGDGVEQGGHPSPAGSLEKGLSLGGRGTGGNNPSLLRLRNKDLEDMGLGIPEALWG